MTNRQAIASRIKGLQNIPTENFPILCFPWQLESWISGRSSSKPWWPSSRKHTIYHKKYAHGFCFAVLFCGYTLTDFPISTRLTSLALWQSNDCPSASKATLMNMDKYFMWIHYGRLHNHNKAKHNKTVCIFIGIYCMCGVLIRGNKWKWSAMWC